MLFSGVSNLFSFPKDDGSKKITMEKGLALRGWFTCWMSGFMTIGILSAWRGSRWRVLGVGRRFCGQGCPVFG
jgi:hypothetical protein